MNEENNIDKLFREKLKDLSETPPAFVWDGVKEKLANGRRKKRAAWYSWSAVAALLVLAFVAGWYFNESSEKPIPQTGQNEVVKTDSEDVSDDPNPPAVPDNMEENEGREQKNAEFLADASDRGLTGKKDDVADHSDSAKKREIIASRPEIAIPDKIISVEASLHVSNKLKPEAVSSVKKISTGLSAQERAMISRNAAAIKVPGNERAGWRMGVNVSPGYSSYAVKHGNDYASNMTQVANDGNANVSGGVAIRYNTSRRWSLESGIYYAQNGKQAGSSPQVYGSREQALYSAAPERLYFNTAVTMETSGVAMNSIAGVIEIENMPAGAEIAADLENAGFYGNSLITQGELSQVFDLVEIPLYLRYLLVDSNLDVELLGGINAGVIVGNQAFLENQFGVQRIGRTRDISTMNFSGALGLAFSYALGKNFSLGVEPRFNYYMTSISRNPEVDFRPYRIGVYTGLYYSF